MTAAAETWQINSNPLLVKIVIHGDMHLCHTIALTECCNAVQVCCLEVSAGITGVVCAKLM